MYIFGVFFPIKKYKTPFERIPDILAYDQRLMATLSLSTTMALTGGIAAFLGSWAQVLPDVERLVGGAPILGPTASASATAAAVQAAEEDWRVLAARPGSCRL